MHDASTLDAWARVRFWGGEDWFTDVGHAHNWLLQTAVQGGAAGLCAASAALFWVLARSRGACGGALLDARRGREVEARPHLIRFPFAPGRAGPIDGFKDTKLPSRFS